MKYILAATILIFSVNLKKVDLGLNLKVGENILTKLYFQEYHNSNNQWYEASNQNGDYWWYGLSD